MTKMGVGLIMGAGFLFFAASATATVIHVPADYATIQAGVNASINGDTVLVADGIYQENINLGGRNIMLMSQSGPDAAILEYLSPSQPLVSFVNGEGPGAVLKGFTLRRNFDYQCSSPVYIISAGPVIYGNKFLYNRTEMGGGIRISNGNSVRISNNYFAFDSTQVGGGVYCEGGSAVIDSNTFCHNNVYPVGGAISLEGTHDCSVHHNLIYSNHSGAYCGGISTQNTVRADIFNNTIVSNSNDELLGGDGIHVWYSDSCRVYNNIVANNDSIGFCIHPAYHNSATYDDVWGNDDDYYDWNGGLGPGEGCISADPRFVGGDPYSYRLSSISPCIDAGDPNSPLDPDGTIADIGAFYGIGGSPPVSDSCYIGGTLVNGTTAEPVVGASIIELKTGYGGTSDAEGDFILGPFENIRPFNVSISANDFRDTTIYDVVVVPRDTVSLDTIRLQEWPSGDPYISGDINGDGDASPLADLIYGDNYFFGGPPPPISNFCGDRYLYSAGDVNGNCMFNGIDIVYGTSYWSGGDIELHYCSECRPPQPDTLFPPGGIDPGIPDTVIFGKLDLTPISAFPGDTIPIPVWVKTDESVPAMNIPVAADTAYLTQWLGGIRQNPVSGWYWCDFRQPQSDRPSPGYMTQTLLGWRLVPSDSSCLNTYGAYRQVATFMAASNPDSGHVGDSIQVIPGSHSRAGLAAFCDSAGLTEWAPVMVAGRIAFGPRIPDIEVSPATFCDTVFAGYQTTSNVYISNLGGNDLTYSVGSDVAFISVSPDSGLAHPIETDTIRATISAAFLPEGTYSANISVNSDDPDQPTKVIPGTVVVQNAPPCIYVPGDVNGSGVTNGIDVTYFVSYLKGGPAPPISCDCPPHDALYVAADANGNCATNGIDVTYMVSYFKGGPTLMFCADCPPAGIMPPTPAIKPVERSIISAKSQ